MKPSHIFFFYICTNVCRISEVGEISTLHIGSWFSSPEAKQWEITTNALNELKINFKIGLFWEWNNLDRAIKLIGLNYDKSKCTKANSGGVTVTRRQASIIDCYFWCTRDWWEKSTHIFASNRVSETLLLKCVPYSEYHQCKS